MIGFTDYDDEGDPFECDECGWKIYRNCVDFDSVCDLCKLEEKAQRQLLNLNEKQQQKVKEHMNTTTEINLEAKRSFKAPASIRRNERDVMTVTLKAYRLNGNEHPHFSATASSLDCGGCLHDEIQKVWPEAEPIIKLHLSNADDGAPMYAEENGYYWLAGVVGGLGEQYHGGSGSSGKSADECLRILADHLRIDLDAARTLASQISDVYDSVLTSDKASEARQSAKIAFGCFVNTQRERWQKDAEAGRELIQQLAG